MQKIHYILISFTLLTGLWSCVVEPDYPNEPQIEYVGVSSNYVDVNDGFTTLTFSFTDGDGDLGGSNVENATCNTFSVCEFTSDSSCFNDPFWSCFIIDGRDSCYQFLQLPDLKPNGNIKAISGEIDVVLNIVPKQPFPAFDTVRYQIVVKDRSGNYSNTIETGPIIIVN